MDTKTLMEEIERAALKKYRSLSGQAEDADTYESYKELIDTIREMSNEELYGIMRDCETALKVLVRGDHKKEHGGCLSLAMRIRDLAAEFVGREEKPKTYCQYTYEFIEKERAAGR